jgi:uncharacterized phage infection (PIP) family protein YhgE
MINDTSEETARRLNLQFFAGEGDGSGDIGGLDGLDDTLLDDGPNPDPSPDDTQPDETEESFIEEDLLPEELKNSKTYKGMQKKYNQSLQEIAPFRNVLKNTGLTADQAAGVLQMLNDDPVGFMERYAPQFGVKLTKTEQKQLEQEVKKVEEVSDGLDPEDPYAQQLLEVAEKRLEAKLLKKFEPLMQRHEVSEKAEAAKFFRDVDTAIEKVIKDYPEAGLTRKQLYNVAQNYRLLPEKMEDALYLALGPQKYLEVMQQRQLRTKAKTAIENQTAVAPVVNGQPARTLPQRPRTFEEATKNVLNYFNSLK